jgi:hypothetical protein
VPFIVAKLDSRECLCPCNAGNAEFLVAAGFHVFIAALGTLVDDEFSGLIYPFAVFVEGLGHALTLP